MKKNLAVCVVGNFRYLRTYFFKFKSELEKIGKYKGEIVIITSIFCPTILLRSTFGNNISVLRFRKIHFSKKTRNILDSNYSDGQPNRNKNKSFQWHKLHIFDEKLKRFNKIFYLDLKSYIHGDLSDLLNLNPQNSLLARSDTYPNYINELSSQFDKNAYSFTSLSKKYDLTIKNYFQTSLLFYDTQIINSDTKKNLIELAEKYPCTISNEQAICNLYFIFEKNQYKELPDEVKGKKTFYYWMVQDEDILITKQNRIQYK